MVNFPTSLDNFTNPTATDATNSVTVPHATQHSDLNDAVEALEAKVGIDGSSVATSIDYKVANKQDVSVEKSTDFTAALHGNYVVTATATVTDPAPEAGHGFTVLVRNGTVTVGGTAYSVVGTRIERTYHSGAWANAVWYPVTGGEGTATHVLTSNGAGVAPSFQAAGGGGFLELSIADYQGPAVVGILGRYTATRSGTLGSIRLVSDTLPVGANCVAELRKNSTTSGNVLSATLQITTTESATNGQYIGTAVSTFSSAAIAAGDVFYVVLTYSGASMTTPPANVRALLYTT